jgi:hypothetical protein
LLTCFLNDFEMVPVTPIITAITLVFTMHIIIIINLKLYYATESLNVSFRKSRICYVIDCQSVSSK